MPDKYELERFKAAQDICYHKVTAELRAGRKRSHWIWFVFPQIRGLGKSQMDARYAIQSPEEARAYLNDTLLSGRLLECVNLLLAHTDSDIRQIMGYPDDLKLRSSMTLFKAVASQAEPFQGVLDAYYSGKPDAITLTIIEEMQAV